MVLLTILIVSSAEPAAALESGEMLVNQDTNNDECVSSQQAIEDFGDETINQVSAGIEDYELLHLIEPPSGGIESPQNNPILIDDIIEEPPQNIAPSTRDIEGYYPDTNVQSLDNLPTECKITCTIIPACIDLIFIGLAIVLAPYLSPFIFLGLNFVVNSYLAIKMPKLPTHLVITSMLLEAATMIATSWILTKYATSISDHVRSPTGVYKEARDASANYVFECMQQDKYYLETGLPEMKRTGDGARCVDSSLVSQEEIHQRTLASPTYGPGYKIMVNKWDYYVTLKDRLKSLKDHISKYWTSYGLIKSFLSFKKGYNPSYFGIRSQMSS